MTLGTSLFLIALGAILYWAVDFSISGLEIHTVGLILMIVGIIGAILSMIWMSRATRRTTIVRDRDRGVYRDDPGVY